MLPADSHSADNDQGPAKKTLFGAVKLADLVVPHLRSRFRYAPGLKWLEFTGSKWECVEEDRPLHVLVTVVENYVTSGMSGGGDMAQVYREAAEFSKGSTQMHALKIARSHPAVATPNDRFDQYPLPGMPFRFHTSNGFTVEFFRNGTTNVRETRADDLNTKVGCAYDPTARAPITGLWWSKYQPDDEIRRFQIQQAGRGLAGMGDETFTVWYGETGGNGKGTIEEVLTAIAGEYAVKLPVAVLAGRSIDIQDKYRNELASLRGARVVFADEPEEGSRFNTAAIKQITGGSPMTARPMYKGEITFTPRISLTLVTNNRPSFGADGGFRRRYIEIEWKYEIGRENIRRTFKDDIAAEAPGVLNILIAHWTGDAPLTLPEKIQNHTDEATRASQPVARFHDEAIVVDEGIKVRAKELYAAYRQWCDRNGEKAYSNTRFGQQFAKTKQGGGVYEKKTSNGTWYEGVDIHDDFKPSARYLDL